MIAWRAALLAGYPSADQYLVDIDSDEWTELLAFNELDPIGEQRGDIRNACLMALIAAAHGDKNAKPIDFMPFSEEPRKPANDEIIAQRLDELFGVSRARNHR